MPMAIEDYALIGDCTTAALVGRDGSIDWLCLPRFDSESTFGALLGTEDHGRWLLAPVGEATCTRRYEDDTFVLVTEWTTPTGRVEVTDLMPTTGDRPRVLRRVRGLEGAARMEIDLRIRFDYSAALPWMRQLGELAGRAELVGVAGPDGVVVRGPRLEAADHAHRAEFEVAVGETVDLELAWYASHEPPPPAIEPGLAIERTKEFWRGWASGIRRDGAYPDAVRRSLLVLRALTHHETGGIVAAVTTSLPEAAGGARNWDYRYVWLRDAALALEALMTRGSLEEAEQWRAWLLRAIAGDPADVQIMYGLSGERRLPERRVRDLPGYLGASPVRVGNAAYRQYQADIFGEVLLALRRARERGMPETEFSWPLQVALLRELAAHWRRRDRGIWEVRGASRHFTHSRAMIWAAFDCGVDAVQRHGLSGPVDEWIRMRDALRAEIDERGVSAAGHFVQAYGTDEVDAALLQLPHLGFCAPDDPRMLATVARIEADLLRDGLVLRYRTVTGVDGLDGDEHPFLACSFWLVEQYARSGRRADAERLMDRLVGAMNDVGLLAEELDARTGAHWGNTPQAFSHLALIGAAAALSGR